MPADDPIDPMILATDLGVAREFYGLTGGDPVITTVTRRVRRGHEAAYEQFLEGLISVARTFPGHLGVEVFRPPSVLRLLGVRRRGERRCRRRRQRGPRSRHQVA